MVGMEIGTLFLKVVENFTGDITLDITFEAPIQPVD